jgi:hypothetical protein
VTVTVYVPAIVAALSLRPPQEQRNVSNTSRVQSEERLLNFGPRNPLGRTANPTMVKAHSHGVDQDLVDPIVCTAGARVVTVAVKRVACVALTVCVAGTLQVTPAGAVHLSDAVSVMPAPPMVREYLAVFPASTVAELELPGAIPSPNPADTPVAVSETDWGLSGASSAIVRFPVDVPTVVGANTTCTLHVPKAANPVPQVLV